MTDKAEILIAEARKLSPDERIEVAEAILASLDLPGTERDLAWLHEAKDRLAAYKRGELTARDFDHVLAKYGKQ